MRTRERSENIAPTARAARAGLAALFALLAGSAPLAAASEASPDRKRDMALCDDHTANRDERIAACTRLIDEETGGNAEERASLFNNRADAWYRLGEYKKALADRSHAIRVDPQGTSGYCGRGGLHKQLGNKKNMLADLQMCIRLTSEKIAANPKDINAYNRRSYAYMVLRDMDAAIDDASRAIELAPSDPFRWISRGYYRQAAGRHRLALEDLTKAIELGVPAYWQRAQSYKALGDYKNALRDLDKYVESSPDRKMTQYLGPAGRAAIYRNMGELEKALEHAKKAVSIMPAHPIAQATLGYVYHLLGRHDDALGPLNHVIERQPNSHHLLYARGFAYEQAGKTDLAIKDYKKVLSLGHPRPEDEAWDPWEVREDVKSMRLARARLKALGHPVAEETESGAGSERQGDATPSRSRADDPDVEETTSNAKQRVRQLFGERGGSRSDITVARLGGRCAYDSYRGQCRIVSVKKTAASMRQATVGGAAGYGGYDVRFRYSGGLPGDSALANRARNQQHRLRLTNSWYPGPRYLKKYGIAEGKRFACMLKVRTKGSCPPILFDFPAIDQRDYFESDGG